METPIFSTRQIQRFTPASSPRTYLLQPLDVFQELEFRAAVTRRGLSMPSLPEMYRALRAALHEAAPANLDELMAIVDQAEAEPGNAVVQGQFAALERRLFSVPLYQEMVLARQRYMALVPFLAAQHALRGWEGPDLPPFARGEDGLVPSELIQVISDHGELTAVGSRAHLLMQPGAAAIKNFASGSPSSETPKPAKGRSGRKTGASGTSPARNGKKTRGG